MATQTMPLTRGSATALAAAIRSGQTTSREVVAAHIARLKLVNPTINAIVMDRYDAALQDADAADARIAKAAPDDVLPPFLGVPCTIKESIQYAGMPNCAGVMHRKDFRCETTAPVVERVLRAGAIPLGVTNTSEATMWIESFNRVYGRTRNAYDPRRIAGGSSGGEGAAVGSGGAPFGIGSDIGGSIRLPAFFNGVFGHKASQGVVPNTGQWPESDGDAELMLTIGPLARRAEDLMPLLKAIAGPDGSDRRARAVQLGDPQDVALDGLTVVIPTHASFVPATKEMNAARDAAADGLRRAGAHVREEPLKALRRALELYLNALSDGAGAITPGHMLVPDGDLPKTFRRAWRNRRDEHTPAMLLLLFAELFTRGMPKGRITRLHAAADALRREVEGVIGDGVLLNPPHPRVAPRHGRTVGRPWVITPVATFNLLGLPATVCPLGLNAEGLPTGVQVVAGRDRDHVSIAVALELERQFGGWVPPSGA